MASAQALWGRGDSAAAFCAEGADQYVTEVPTTGSVRKHYRAIFYFLAMHVVLR